MKDCLVKYFVLSLSLILTLGPSVMLALPTSKNEAASEVLQRYRRQVPVTRQNFAGLMSVVLDAGNRTQCVALCREYSRNERERAMRDPLRGPNSRNQFFRSGGTSYSVRYFQTYDLQERLCLATFCDRISTPTPMATTATAEITTPTAAETTIPPTTAEETTPPAVATTEVTTPTAAETTMPRPTTAEETTPTVAEMTTPMTTEEITTTAAETTMPMTTEEIITMQVTTMTLDGVGPPPRVPPPPVLS